MKVKLPLLVSYKNTYSFGIMNNNPFFFCFFMIMSLDEFPSFPLVV